MSTIPNACAPNQRLRLPLDCERHIVLVCPEIHWNTGNIGRTCIGTGAILHLIRPLGFSLDSPFLKRAGLDYWQHVDLHVWDDFSVFLQETAPPQEEILLFSKKADTPYWQMPTMKRMFLVFGSETKGLPESILNAYRTAVYSIPITDKIRSLNLSSAAGIVLYETLRTYWMSQV